MRALSGWVVCLILLQLVAAQQYMYQPPSSAKLVETTVHFPKFPTKAFPVGEQIDSLIGVHNGEKLSLNFSLVAGAIATNDGKYQIANFTTETYNVMLGNGFEATMNYAFTLPVKLPIGRYRMGLRLFYFSPTVGERYSNQVFNESIEVTEQDKLIDTEILFMYLILLAIVAAIGYVIYSYVSDMPAFKKQMKKKDTSKGKAEVSNVAETDWAKYTNLSLSRKGTKGMKKGSRKGSKADLSENKTE